MCIRDRQCDGQLDDSKVGTEVSAGLGDLVHQERPDLLGQQRHLVGRQCLEILGTIDRFQQLHALSLPFLRTQTLDSMTCPDQRITISISSGASSSSLPPSGAHRTPKDRPAKRSPWTVICPYAAGRAGRRVSLPAGASGSNPTATEMRTAAEAVDQAWGRQDAGYGTGRSRTPALA